MLYRKFASYKIPINYLKILGITGIINKQSDQEFNLIKDLHE